MIVLRATILVYGDQIAIVPNEVDAEARIAGLLLRAEALFHAPIPLQVPS